MMPRAFPPTLTATDFFPQALGVVWDPRLKADPGGPAPIFHVAVRQLLLSHIPPFYLSLQHTVAQEVEAFLSSIPHRGFSLVEREPEFGHHRLRPGQSLSRVSAAEDDEVVGVRDNVRTERFPTPRQPPMLQEPIHVDVGKQWARNAPLRRAARVALASIDPPGPIAFLPLFDRRLEPQLDQPQHLPIDDPTRHRLHKIGMRNRIEVAG